MYEDSKTTETFYDSSATKGNAITRKKHKSIKKPASAPRTFFLGKNKTPNKKTLFVDLDNTLLLALPVGPSPLE